MRSKVVLLLTFLLFSIFNAQASSQKVLYTFTGGIDGAQPLQAGVVFDQAGNLYGVTQGGGAYNLGTVFELTPSPDGSWTETVLWSFTGGSDGSTPQGGLAYDGGGNVYGTTIYGGTINNWCGTLFLYQIQAPPGTGFELLHSFNDISRDGCQSQSDVVYDGYYVYGTTVFGGGRAEGGTIFRWGPGGEYLVWRCPGKGNWWPSGLSLFGNGLYGTASGFGYFPGNVFEVFGYPIYEVRPTRSFSLKSKEGYYPMGDLATQVNEEGLRIMYGATYQGGVGGLGAIYQLTEKIKGSDRWHISLVHSFSGSDGAYPGAGVVLDAAGNLYGTTRFGGRGNSGTVFKLTPGAKNKWTYNMLYSFTGAADGAQPTGALVFDNAGNLYGTTYAGGAYGQGVVYEVTP